jgi:hypothetical protein
MLTRTQYLNCSFLVLLACTALSRPAVSQTDEKCKDVLSCAQLAAESAARAEAAASAMRRVPVISNVTGSRTLGTVYQNTSHRTMLVIVTGKNSAAEFSMFGNVAAAPDVLPAGKTGGGSATTQVGTSFYGEISHLSSITFVVPADSYYNVTTDGGSIDVALWTEVDL